MDQNKQSQPIDTANEPVKSIDDADFMDTGVLYEDPKGADE